MRNIRTLKTVIGIILGLSIALNCLAVTVASDTNPTAVEKSLQLQPDTPMDEQLADLKEKVNNQTKQINEIRQSVQYFGTIFTMLFIAISFAIFGKARSDGKKAAKDETHKLFRRFDADLEKRFENISQLANSPSQGKIHDRKIDLPQPLHKDTTISTKTSDPVTQPSESEKQINQSSDELENRPSYEDWNALAFAAYNANNLDEAIICWDNAIQAAPYDPIKVALALNDKGFALAKLQRYDESLKVCEELVALFGKNKNPELCLQVAYALNYAGFWLGELNRHVESIQMCDKLILLYAYDNNPDLRVQVAYALNRKGRWQGELKRFEACIETCDELVSRYGQDSNPEIRNQVANALNNKALGLSGLKRYEEAARTYDKLITQFGQDNNPELRSSVATALNNQSISLQKLHRYEESLQISTQLLALYGDDNTPAIRGVINLAQNSKGFVLLCQSKEKWQSQPELSRTKLEEAKALFTQSETQGNRSAFLLSNQAYAAWLSGDKELAEAKFRTALQAENGGDTIYNATQDDFKIFPIAEDQGFKQLTDQLYQEYKRDRSISA